MEAGRPDRGWGHYLRDIIYGALDGVITTLAVVAGATGANLGARVAVILGLANLVADGLSMGASNYLGLKSELQQLGRSVEEEMPWRHGAATFAAFAVAGAIPLIAFLLPGPPAATLAWAVAAAAAVLLFVGAARARFIRQQTPGRAGLEMLAVGLAAGAAAYGVGAAARLFV